MTAEEFYNSNEDYYMEIDEGNLLFDMMREFAKYHVKKALESAAGKVEFDEEVLIRQSILQAYPEENIK